MGNVEKTQVLQQATLTALPLHMNPIYFLRDIHDEQNETFNHAKTDRPVQASLQEIQTPVSASASSSLHVQCNIIALTQ